MDLYEYATDGYERTLVFQSDGGFSVGPVSRDEHYAALVKPRTTSDSEIWLFDRRVLRVQSDEIVEPVLRNGVPVEYVLFPDEGHGFVKCENEIRGYRAIAGFREMHLKGKRRSWQAGAAIRPHRKRGSTTNRSCSPARSRMPRLGARAAGFLDPSIRAALDGPE